MFADLAQKMPLPENVSSTQHPEDRDRHDDRVQTTQNTALSQTDLTTTYVSANIVTIGGKEVVSQQLLDQSGTPIDRLVLSDLAADYARQLGAQYIAGPGTSGQLRGVTNGTGVVTVAYTTARRRLWTDRTPANSFLNAVVRAKVAVATTRYLPATAIVMHPRRWGWVQEALDGNGRPLITPEDVNGLADQPGRDGSNVAQGAVGTLANLPVYLDPNVPTNLGAGTNQDARLRGAPRGPVLLRVRPADGDVPRTVCRLAWACFFAASPTRRPSRTATARRCRSSPARDLWHRRCNPRLGRRRQRRPADVLGKAASAVAKGSGKRGLSPRNQPRPAPPATTTTAGTSDEARNGQTGTECPIFSSSALN